MGPLSDETYARVYFTTLGLIVALVAVLALLGHTGALTRHHDTDTSDLTRALYCDDHHITPEDC